jgi:AcrR family transcriptional regulator
VHHFRSKADLVIAAVVHLANQRAEVGWREVERILAASDPVGALLDTLWQVHNGPIFTATVELWVAARTDAELSRHVQTVEPIVTGRLEQIASTSLGGAAANPELLLAVYTSMDAMRGLLISAWHLSKRQRNARWRRAKQELRLLFANVDLPVAPTT